MNKATPNTSSTITLLITLSIITIYSLTTYQRNSVWLTPEDLWGDVISKNKNNTLAYLNLGVEYAAQERYDDALLMYKLALEANPFNAKAHLNRGSIFHLRRDFANAEIEYRAALALDDIFVARSNLGFLLFEVGRLEESRIELEKSVARAPMYVMGRYNLGTLYLAMGSIEKAEEQFILGFEASKRDNQSLFVGLGKVRVLQGRFNEAEDLFIKALQLNPGLSEGYNGLGLVKEGRGDLRGAIKEFRKALDLAPSFKESDENIRRVVKRLLEDR